MRRWGGDAYGVGSDPSRRAGDAGRRLRAGRRRRRGREDRGRRPTGVAAGWHPDAGPRRPVRGPRRRRPPRPCRDHTGGVHHSGRLRGLHPRRGLGRHDHDRGLRHPPAARRCAAAGHGTGADSRRPARGRDRRRLPRLPGQGRQRLPGRGPATRPGGPDDREGVHHLPGPGDAGAGRGPRLHARGGRRRRPGPRPRREPPHRGAAPGTLCRRGEDRRPSPRPEPAGRGRGRHGPQRPGAIPADRLPGLLRARDRARLEGAAVWAETCPQYVFLDDSCYAAEDGELYICSPPIRPREVADRLWEMVRQGAVQVWGSDHCCYDTAQKFRHRGDFTRAPNGLPGVELRAPLLFSEGVMTGLMSVPRFAALTATNPAKLNGLFPRKGVIAPGADADLAVYDPGWEVTVTAPRLHMATDYTPFEGRRLRGWPRMVFSRGRLLVDGERFDGTAGTGQVLATGPPIPL